VQGKLGTGDLFSAIILEARGGQEPKGRGLEVQLSPSATQKPWQRIAIVAGRYDHSGRRGWVF